MCLLAGVCLALIEEAVVWLPSPLLALATGLLLGHWAPVRPQRGAAFAASRLLRAGIVLLGFRLSLEQLHDVGVDAMLMVVPSILVGGGVAFLAASLARLEMRLRILLAAGTAICGNTAIATIAPAIEARDEEVAASVTTVTLYGTLALVVFPLAAHALGLSDRASGLWVGSAINDTSQVVAASYSMSDSAGTVATMVKLTRNLFIAPVAIIASFVGARRHRDARSVRSAIPWFVIAFIAAVGIASLATLPTTFVSAASYVSKILILSALTGIGIRAAGLRLDRAMLVPLAVGSFAGVLLAVFSLVLVAWVA